MCSQSSPVIRKWRSNVPMCCESSSIQFIWKVETLMKERKASEKRRAADIKAMRKEQQKMAACGVANAVIPAVARMTEVTYAMITRSTEAMFKTIELLEKHSIHIDEALEGSHRREELLSRRLIEMQEALAGMHKGMMGMRETVQESFDLRSQQARESTRDQPCSKTCDKKCDKSRSRKK